MGNNISLHSNYKGNIESLSMSNGATFVLLETLVLSGSDLAKTTKEKEFVVWIAQRDQSIIGVGTVGFRIDEMPWSIENFIDEKEFLFSVIDNAILKHRWGTLSYTPNEEIITRCLTHFRSLISEFQKEDVDSSHYLYWSSTDDIDNTPTVPLGFPKCEKHLIYLSCHGCIICNS